MLSDLIVPIDADLGGLRKGLRDAQQLIRRSTADLGALGMSLTRSISLPLAAIGVGAIKAAADLQQLTTALSTTMQGAGYSIQEATKEMSALRDAAKAPGLDFEQAIKGSIRLQNVGYSAAKARDILVELANAISMSGGTAAELDSVTRQFAQMSAKGRILQEDLTIIVENMPVLSKIMKETFGTVSAEGLRDMGISADDFIQKVTEGMKTLPRVTGGLANDIVNAFNAIKLAAAQVGTVLNDRLKIGEKLSGFADFISGLADAFRDMSPTAQTAILGMAAFAAALGPAVKLSSMMISGIGGMATSIAKLRIFLLEALVGTEGLTAAQVRMNAVMKANVIGAIIGVTLALAAAYAVLRKDTSAAAQAQEQVGIVEKMASNSVAEQMVKVDLLTNTLKSSISSLKAKKEALAELNQIAPEYFGKLKIGVDATNEITSATNLYRESLMKVARAIAAQEQLVTIEKQLNDIRLKRGTFSDEEKAALGVLGVAINTADALERQKKVLDAQEAPLVAMRNKLSLIAEENRTVADTTKKVTDKTIDNTDSVKDNTKVKNEQVDAIKAENAQWESQVKMLGEIEAAWLAQAQAEVAAVEARAGQPNAGDTTNPGGQILSLGQNMGSAISAMSTPLVTVTGELQSFATAWMATIETALTPAQQIMENLKNGVAGFGQTWTATSELVASSGSVMKQAFMGMGDAISQAAASGASSFKELAGAALKSAREIVGAWIRQGVAAAVSKALTSIPFPFNIAAGAAAGGLAQAAFNGVLKGLKIPAFAAGTDYAPGGLSLVGELGPELVNLPKGSQVIPNHRMGSAMATEVRITGQLVARGGDLVYVIDETNRKQRRTK